MTVKDLREALNGYPDDMEVITQKTKSKLYGNVARVNSVKEGSYALEWEYGYLGIDVPCVLLTDEIEPQTESEE